ncbi:MAG: MmcQ/YjbR family DNA-binding protein [Ruminococcus sp.]|nr:MmcQ/YjbR family DNA-binding protein [Ruminococcus sp.]
MTINREDIFRYVREKYSTSPDYPWERDADSAVLRKSNKKWYGLVMNIRRSVIDGKSEGCTDILNVKCSQLVREVLIGEGKAIPAYHMNKRLWISIPLDGGISFTEICGVIDESYELVK